MSAQLVTPSNHLIPCCSFITASFISYICFIKFIFLFGWSTALRVLKREWCFQGLQEWKCIFFFGLDFSLNNTLNRQRILSSKRPFEDIAPPISLSPTVQARVLTPVLFNSFVDNFCLFSLSWLAFSIFSFSLCIRVLSKKPGYFLSISSGKEFNEEDWRLSNPLRERISRTANASGIQIGQQLQSCFTMTITPQASIRLVPEAPSTVCQSPHSRPLLLLGKTLMVTSIEGRKRRRWQRMRWLGSITDSMDMSLSILQERVIRKAWHAALHGVTKSWTWLSNQATTTSPKHPYVCFQKSVCQNPHSSPLLLLETISVSHQHPQTRVSGIKLKSADQGVS